MLIVVWWNTEKVNKKLKDEMQHVCFINIYQNHDLSLSLIKLLLTTHSRTQDATPSLQWLNPVFVWYKNIASYFSGKTWPLNLILAALKFPYKTNLYNINMISLKRVRGLQSVHNKEISALFHASLTCRI